MIIMDPLSVQHIEKGKNQLIMVVLLSISTFLLAIYALGQGSSSNLDMWTTAKILFGIDDPSDLQSDIIWKLRFPRILIAVIGGVALATAGSLMQGCLANPLVSPLTLGVASGAALGAALAIVLGITIVDIPNLGIVVNAFLFSLIVVHISRFEEEP